MTDSELRNDDVPVAAENPYATPDQAPTSAAGASGQDSPLVQRLKRGTGNDLIFCALLATLAAYFVPFGFVLDIVSLFLLTRVIVSRSKPSTGWVVCGIVVAIWNTIQLGLLLISLFVTPT